MSETKGKSEPKDGAKANEELDEEVEEEEQEEIDPSIQPEFIFGGPFIEQEKEEAFINAITPINLPLQGTFKQSLAHYSMKVRIPKILRKVLDYMKDEKMTIMRTGAGEDEINKAVEAITNLKEDIEANKRFTRIKPWTLETIKWNNYVRYADPPRYFTCNWAFSESYIYRKLREPFESSITMKKFDPFGHLKKESLLNSIEPMCVVANRLAEMVTENTPEMIAENLSVLMKFSLWANRQDLAFSSGSAVDIHPDPVQMVTELKSFVLLDDSKKAAKAILTRSAKTEKDVAKAATAPFKQKCSCTRLADPNRGKKGKGKGKGAKVEDDRPPPPQRPCPSKMKLPTKVMIDIVCDNAGYELFTDMCLAYFLLKMKVVEMVRLHVKQIPWFVSDATPTDVMNLIKFCLNTKFEKEIPAPPSEEPPEVTEDGETIEQPLPPPTIITSDKLNDLGDRLNVYLNDDKFLLQSDDFWVSPCYYKDMKDNDPHLYRKLQFAVAVLFKGDLNYRKLIGEINYVRTVPFNVALEGFQPAPIIAIRTIKSPTICGLTEAIIAKAEKVDPKWMETGEFGLIQFFPKADKLKPSNKPCVDFGWRCKGYVCPKHKEL